ncbi:hypothetical protein MKY91_01865 [Alkalicoccobacillus gibsonii]|uniref:YvrJ family protein n=1 Tax=Alkalicoccobacillus gibsonii TaxID=79881 RepID=A0ABU9VDF0_9BACI
MWLLIIIMLAYAPMFMTINKRLRTLEKEIEDIKNIQQQNHTKP